MWFHKTNQRHYEFQTIACVVGMNTIKEGSVSLEIQTGTQKTPPKQKQNKNKPKKKKKKPIQSENRIFENFFRINSILFVAASK